MDIKLKTLGADPEFFLADNKGTFPAVGVIPGTKEEPEPMGKGFFLQRDGLLAEGNIPPATTKKMFISNMQHLKQTLTDLIKLRNLHLLYQDSARYTPRFLKLPEAYEFGCAPVHYVWNTYGFPVPDKLLQQELVNSCYRPAGFHIHIGFVNSTPYANVTIGKILVKLFDLFVTNPLRHIYNDKFRQKYYGQWGSHRIKSYGVECRSLGSYFTQDQYLEYIWDQIIKMIDYFNICKTMLLLNALDINLTPELTSEGLISPSLYKALGINLEEQLFYEKKKVHV